MHYLQTGRGETQIDKFLWLIVAVVVAMIDQASKAIARNLLTPGDSIPVIGNFFQLTLVFNAGASFGLFQGMRILIVLFGLIAFAAFLYFLLVKPPASRLLVGAIAVAGGGAAGNLIDRVFTGTVTDFFDVSFWPVFNVADIAITAGVTLIIINMILSSPDTISSANKEVL